MGACSFGIRLHRSWGFVREAATPPWDADVVYPSHLLGICLRLSAGQMTSAWFGHILALPGAQKPEGGAGASPQTPGRRPGWRQIERDVSTSPVAWAGPAAGKAWR